MAATHSIQPFELTQEDMERQAHTPVTDDAFSMVGDDPTSNIEDRDRYVKNLFQTPPTCKCCVNWVDEAPEKLCLDEDKVEEEDDDVPLIVRRRRAGGGVAKTWKVHAIEIKNAALRSVLLKVFDDYQFLMPKVKYLTFYAPFHPFHHSWDKFETAIKDEKDEVVLNALNILKRFVKASLGSELKISKEFIASGVISYSSLWTLFKPGDLLYEHYHGVDSLVRLKSVSDAGTSVVASYIDWNGTKFGWVDRHMHFLPFVGTKEITNLEAYPAHMHPNFDELKQRLIQRGQKFKDLAGVHTKSYSMRDERNHQDPNAAKILRRIIVDAKTDRNRIVHLHSDLTAGIPLHTNQIQQHPIQSSIQRPGHQHIPLDSSKKAKRNDWTIPPHPYDGAVSSTLPMHPPPLPPGMDLAESHVKSGKDVDLTPDELMLCNDRVHGFCLRDRRWRPFEVDRICDVDWNEEPFNNLVLPEGYKDLIIAFVESQLKHNERFEDVINGKGGGLVILLCGAPGVGKTLTAESVAEKLKTPLFKMEPTEEGGDSTDLSDDEQPSHGRMPIIPNCMTKKITIEDQFTYATAWKSVLLFDECDAYLGKRSGVDSDQDRLLNKFLRKLEYFPSLLFLTTNHAESLDPAIASRVHLTINYPGLDTNSRLTIWRNFLDRANPPAALSWSEIELLSRIELNGRRIRNVVKTAQIMARREQRAVRLDDIKKVMKITEGLQID